MSYDIDLIDQETKKPAAVENHEEGGTYATIGSQPPAMLDMPYLYY
jgi:hypothetical protein